MSVECSNESAHGLYEQKKSGVVCGKLERGGHAGWKTRRSCKQKIVDAVRNVVSEEICSLHPSVVFHTVVEDLEMSRPLDMWYSDFSNELE